MNRIFSIIIIALLTGCRMGEPERHEDFMSLAECYVYKDEVDDESLEDYRVEYIDTSEASECVKTMLNDTYLLYDNESYIVVSPKHPRNYLKQIERYQRDYKTDTTRLSGFSIWNDNQISLTVSKKYYDPEYKSLEYHDWEYLFLSKQGNRWVMDSLSYIKMWPWSNTLHK